MCVVYKSKFNLFMKKKITIIFTAQVLHDFHLICLYTFFFACFTVRFDIYYESRHTKEYVTFGSRFVFYMMEGVCS